MTVRESFLSRATFSVDSKGTRTGVREFYTDYRDPASCNADNTNVPALGSTFPGDNGLRLDRRVNNVRDDGTFIIRCEYSSNESFTETKVDKKPGTYYAWQGTVQTAEAKIWIVSRRKLTVPSSGSTPTVKQIWQGTQYTVREKRQMVTLTIRTTNITIVNPFNAIADQYQKLHKLGGAYWLFAGGDANQTNQTDWEFTYQWVKDNGTPMPDLAGQSESNPVYVIVPNNTVNLGVYAREPYTEAVYVDADNPETTIGYGYSVKLYTKDDNGWQSLPGVAGVVSG